MIKDGRVTRSGADQIRSDADLLGHGGGEGARPPAWSCVTSARSWKSVPNHPRGINHTGYVHTGQMFSLFSFKPEDSAEVHSYSFLFIQISDFLFQLFLTGSGRHANTRIIPGSRSTV